MKDYLSPQTKRFHILWERETRSERDYDFKRREVAEKRKKSGYKNGGNKGTLKPLEIGKNKA